VAAAATSTSPISCQFLPAVPSDASVNNQKTTRFLTNLIETLRLEMGNLKREISDRINSHSKRVHSEIESVKLQRRLSEIVKMNQRKERKGALNEQRSKEILQVQSLLNKVSNLHQKTSEKLRIIAEKKHREMVSKQHESQNAALHEILSFLQKSRLEQAAFDSKCSSESRIMKKIEENSRILAEIINERQKVREKTAVKTDEIGKCQTLAPASESIVLDNVIGFIKTDASQAYTANTQNAAGSGSKVCPRREMNEVVKLALSRYISTDCKLMSTLKMGALAQSPTHFRHKVKRMLQKLNLATADASSPFFDVTKLLDRIVFSVSAKLQQINAGCPPPNYDHVQYVCEKIRDILH
jgi:hypothetical protein